MTESSTSSTVPGETTVPWHHMSIWKLSGVLLLICLIAVIIQQVIKRLMSCFISYCRKSLCGKTEDTRQEKDTLRSLQKKLQQSRPKLSESERNDDDVDLPLPSHAKPHVTWDTLDRAKTDGYVQMKSLKTTSVRQKENASDAKKSSGGCIKDEEDACTYNLERSESSTKPATKEGSRAIKATGSVQVNIGKDESKTLPSDHQMVKKRFETTLDEDLEALASGNVVSDRDATCSERGDKMESDETATDIPSHYQNRNRNKYGRPVTRSQTMPIKKRVVPLPFSKCAEESVLGDPSSPSTSINHVYSNDSADPLGSQRKQNNFLRAHGYSATKNEDDVFNANTHSQLSAGRSKHCVANYSHDRDDDENADGPSWKHGVLNTKQPRHEEVRGSAYRSYYEIDDIDPGQGFESMLGNEELCIRGLDIMLKGRRTIASDS